MARYEYTIDTKLNNELPVKVQFTHVEGFPQTRETPADPDEIEIGEVLLTLFNAYGEFLDTYDLVDLLSEDALEALETNCFHYANQQPEPEEQEDFD